MSAGARPPPPSKRARRLAYLHTPASTTPRHRCTCPHLPIPSVLTPISSACRFYVGLSPTLLISVHVPCRRRGCLRRCRRRRRKPWSATGAAKPVEVLVRCHQFVRTAVFVMRSEPFSPSAISVHVPSPSRVPPTLSSPPSQAPVRHRGREAVEMLHCDRFVGDTCLRDAVRALLADAAPTARPCDVEAKANWPAGRPAYCVVCPLVACRGRVMTS